jgi:hypothetical protein
LILVANKFFSFSQLEQNTRSAPTSCFHSLHTLLRS